VGFVNGKQIAQNPLLEDVIMSESTTILEKVFLTLMDATLALVPPMELHAQKFVVIQLSMLVHVFDVGMELNARLIPKELQNVCTEEVDQMPIALMAPDLLVA